MLFSHVAPALPLVATFAFVRGASRWWSSSFAAVRTWLERLTPPGEDITLPESSGRLVFGRGGGSTIVLDDDRISRQHVELSWADGFWRVRDLGSSGGTFINEERLTERRALFAGDLIAFGRIRLRYRTEEQREPSTFAALLRDPTDEMHWRVYADQLQERGDPLGERIARSLAGQRVDHLPWLRGLWDAFVSGELEVEWKHGFIQRAVVRAVAGRIPAPWQHTVTQLFNLRVGRFLQSLTIDLPRLTAPRPGEHVAPLVERLREAQQSLAGLPSLPSTLERLNLGYELTDTGEGGLEVATGLALMRPKLRETPVFHRARAMELRVVSAEKTVRLSGIDGSRVLTRGTRLRRGGKGVLFIEATPGIPLMAEGNPCHFSVVSGGMQLVAGRMRGEVRVNHRVDAMYELLPGDLIEVQGAARFRVELLP